MIKTLYGKLAAVLVLLLCTLGLLYGAFTVYSTDVFLREVNQRFNRDLARQLLVQRNLTTAETLDTQAIKGLFSHYMHINPAIEIYLLDTRGNILAFEAPQMKIKRHRVDVAPIRRFLGPNPMLPILGDDPRDATRQKVFSAAAFPFHGPVTNYLYVVLSGEDYDSTRALLHDSFFLQLSTSAVIASVVFGLFAGLLIFSLLTRRLRRLAQAMSEFRESGFRRHQRYGGEGGSDEIDQLGHTFDAMAERIIAQVEALEKKDALRRNLVANVSHDLRTPLASLQGYVETLLLKEGELSADQRREYLQTSFKQGERLTRLVEELFELSKLDADEAHPELEPVSLAELVQDLVQKYQLRTAQRDIRLEGDIDPALPLVSADIALMDRVLENLMGNAIGHTPDGGIIRVTTRVEHDRVTVTVGNSGNPIAEADLPHLFDRFYQAPEQRRGSGAGLGLAIVRRILELHHTHPEVGRSEDGLTTFSFTLTAL